MKSSNVKLLWILISITLFVLAVIGTIILILAKSPSEAEKKGFSTETEGVHSALEPLSPEEKRDNFIIPSKEKQHTDPTTGFVSESEEKQNTSNDEKNENLLEEKDSAVNKTDEMPTKESNEDFPEDGLSTIQKRQRETAFVEESQRTVSRIVSKNASPQKTEKELPPPPRPKKEIKKTAPRAPAAAEMSV